MSTLKADTVTTKSDDTDLTIIGGGTGVPNLEAGFKVGGSAGVPTASIQDDAVTLAKMAAAVDGVVISYDASGNPVHVGPGSDGEVLTSTGAGSPPAFEAAAGGAWNFISGATASASSSLDFTGINSTYATYVFVGEALIASGDDRNIVFRTSSDGGSSYDDTGGDYRWIFGYWLAAGTGASVSAVDSSSTFLRPTGPGAGNVGGESVSFVVYLHSPSNASLQTMAHGQFVCPNSSGNPLYSTFSGRRDEVAAVDAFRVCMDSGTITSGTVKMYGIVNS